MGLTGTKVDEVDALGAQFGGLGGYGHGRGDLDPANAVGKDFCRSRDCHSSSIFTDFWGRAKSGTG
jgi:hypothetical protein